MSKSTFSGLQHFRSHYGFIIIRLAVVGSHIFEIPRNCSKLELIAVQFRVIQGHWSWCQLKMHMQLFTNNINPTLPINSNYPKAQLTRQEQTLYNRLRIGHTFNTFLPPEGWRSSNMYTLQFSANCRAYTHQLYWLWYHSPEFLYSF